MYSRYICIHALSWTCTVLNQTTYALGPISYWAYPPYTPWPIPHCAAWHYCNAIRISHVHICTFAVYVTCTIWLCSCTLHQTIHMCMFPENSLCIHVETLPRNVNTCQRIWIRHTYYVYMAWVKLWCASWCMIFHIMRMTFIKHIWII